MNRKTQEAIRLIKDNCCIFCGTPTNEDLRKYMKRPRVIPTAPLQYGLMRLRPQQLTIIISTEA